MGIVICKPFLNQEDSNKKEGKNSDITTPLWPCMISGLKYDRTRKNG